MAKHDAPVQRTFCAIIGAGMCGVALGSEIIRSKALDYSEFRIFDRNADFGGVWEANKYPRAACDIPSHAYVLRSFLNPDWSSTYSSGREIQQYYSRIGDYWNLRKSTLFNKEVISAKFNEESLLWELLIEDRTTKISTIWIVNVVVDGGGQFHRPKYANIPGRELFKGFQWHTSEWPSDIDLKGKRVGIIGTGPSTAQIAPRIQPLVKQLYLYQRSSGHVLPRRDFPTPAWKKALFRWCYPILWLYHIWWYIFLEQSKPMWHSGTKENKMMYQLSIATLEKQVKDPVIREKLRPNTLFGCKRVLMLDDWYPMFNQPNVELVTEKPVLITEKGIVSQPPQLLSKDDLSTEPTGSYEIRVSETEAKTMEREIDVLIWGTGFDMLDFGGDLQLYGLNGVNLSKLWKDYPQTYWCIGVSGFPNLLLMLGPNSANWWSNVTTVVEVQTKYNVKLLKHIKKQNQKSPYALHPKPDVQKAFNDWLRKERGDPAFLAELCDLSQDAIWSNTIIQSLSRLELLLENALAYVG